MKKILVFLFFAVLGNIHAQSSTVVDTMVVTVDLGNFNSNGQYETFSIPDIPVNGKFILVKTTLNVQVPSDTIRIEPKKINFKKL